MSNFWCGYASNFQAETRSCDSPMAHIQALHKQTSRCQRRLQRRLWISELRLWCLAFLAKHKKKTFLFLFISTRNNFSYTSTIFSQSQACFQLFIKMFLNKLFRFSELFPCIFQVLFPEFPVFTTKAIKKSHWIQCKYKNIFIKYETQTPRWIDKNRWWKEKMNRKQLTDGQNGWMDRLMLACHNKLYHKLLRSTIILLLCDDFQVIYWQWCNNANSPSQSLINFNFLNKTTHWTWETF